MPRCTRVILALALAACAPQPPHATIIDAERARISVGELEEGRGLLVRKCSDCHATPVPRDRTAADWPVQVGKMAVRAGIDGRQRTLIEEYLITMAGR